MPRKEFTYSDGTTPRICIIGSGFAGLCAAIQLKRKLKISTIKIFEKNHDVGGVWLKNIYPGCQSDTPGYAYSYSFAPNPEWKGSCAKQAEMWKYIHGVAQKYELYSHIQFNTNVKTARWDEKNNLWKVTTLLNESGLEQTEEFDILIIGTGIFRAPRIPEEYKAFQGPMFHSAEWDYNVPLENKVVGLVGSGASAIQVGPAIAPKTKQLILYQRSAGHIVPKPYFRTNWIFIFLFKIFPFLLWQLRTLFFLFCELWTTAFDDGTVMNWLAGKIFKLIIFSNIRDKELRKTLSPKTKFGCRVVLIGSKFYQMFDRPNVKLNSSKIVKIDGRTVTTEDGATETLDVLVLCTGFKLQDYFAPLQVIGAGGVDLLKMWKEDQPRTYYGVLCNAAPNLFFLGGPNSHIQNHNWLYMIECQVVLLKNLILQLLKQDASSVQVTLQAQEECMNDIEDASRKKVWGSEKICSSIPQNKKGGIPAVFWPKSALNFWRKTRAVDKSKFHFTPRPQCFPQITIEKFDDSLKIAPL